MPALELDGLEARILGVLIEKELTTPEQYPLSLHALAAGCSQKSNRDPVLELSDSEILAGIERLRRRSLVGTSHASSARIERYRHAAGTVWELSQAELAVVAELMLRGAQMPGELRGRADRMSRFETLDALGVTLEGLRQKGFVRRLEPLPGARAPQWEQIVAAPIASAAAGAATTSPGPSATPVQREPVQREPVQREPVQRELAPRDLVKAQPSSLESRVAALEVLVAELKQRLDGRNPAH